MRLSDLRAAVERLEREGPDRDVTWGDVERALPLGRVVDGYDLVAEMMRVDAAAGRGALVGFRELRRAFPLRGESAKDCFDVAVMRYAQAGIVSLHRHDRPAGLSQAQRDEFVFDGVETYYVGCALRPGASSRR